jgi:acetylornithine deacetylase/succinyl-diaminopimelate desuccinylase-like protein
MSPSPSYVALNRATFGATVEEIARMEKMGWKASVEEQLHPDDAAPDDAKKRISSHRLRIRYEYEGTVAPTTMIPGAGGATAMSLNSAVGG